MSNAAIGPRSRLIHKRAALPRRQRGIATILILIFTGLSLSAAVLGVAYRIQGTQEQGTALHAQTQAQIKAWTGAEVVRRYFDVLLANEAAGSGATLSAFATQAAGGPVALTIGGLAGLSATTVSGNASTRQIVVDISATTAENTRAAASARLRAVYRWEAPTPATPPTPPTTPPGVLNFARNLTLGGSITIQNVAGQQNVINVRGNLTTGGNTITGVNVINATGSISIGSGSSFDTLRANGDVRLTGSVTGDQNIQAKGNVCLSGSATALGTVRADGTVIGDGSARYGDVFSRGQSTSTQPAVCATPARDSDNRPYGVDLLSDSGARSVTTAASIRVNSGNIGTLRAAGHLRDTNWGGTLSGQIGGSLQISGSNPAIATWVTVVPGLQVEVPPVDEVVVSTGRFDARELESSANYVFRMVGGYEQVTVRNVAGLADGDYFLFDESWEYKDYLCPLAQRAASSTASAPRCNHTVVGNGLRTVCKGYSVSNTCFTYNTTSGTWTVAGRSLAPGVAWFEGNLTLSDGVYFNTFIATGNITTSGTFNVYAPNYAGYNGVLNGVTYATDDQGRASGICVNASFPGMRPTQFCSGTSYLYGALNGLGNYALMAGSCPNAACSPYTGGNITAGSSTNIRGAIKAGNEFSSGGSTIVHGYVTALALGSSVQSSMGGSTTIRLTGLPPGYDPSGGETTGGGSSGSGGSGGTPGGGTPSVTLRWSRYM